MDQYGLQSRVDKNEHTFDSLRAPLERATVYPVCGTIVGAWCGVIPMALDWDRPWQVCCLIGDVSLTDNG